MQSEVYRIYMYIQMHLLIGCIPILTEYMFVYVYQQYYMMPCKHTTNFYRATPICKIVHEFTTNLWKLAI